MTQEPTHSSADGHGEDADRPPLGQILVESGLLDPRDLERVLEEQRRSGAALGRLLVDGGYVSGPSMALALARQQGTLLKTEYGFGVPQSPVAVGENAELPPALNPPDESELESMPVLRTVELTPIRLAPQSAPIGDEPLLVTEPTAPFASPTSAEAHAGPHEATERERVLQDRIDELTAEQALSLEQSRLDRSRLEELELRLGEAHNQVAALEQEGQRLLAEASSFAADDQALTEARHDYAALREATEEREQSLQARIEELTAEQARSFEQARVDRAHVEELEVRLAADDEALTEARHDYAALREATEEREQSLQARIEELTAEQARSFEQTRVDRGRVEELELLLAEASSLGADDQALTEARHNYATLREETDERQKALLERIDELTSELTSEHVRSSEQSRVDEARLAELELRLGEAERAAATAAEAMAALEQERERLLSEASSSAAADQALAEARHDYATLLDVAEERERTLQAQIDELTAEHARSSEQTRVDRGRVEELEVLLAQATSSAVDDEALAEARRDYAALRHATEEREQALQARIDELTAEQEQVSERTRVDQARVEELELRLGEAQREVDTTADAIAALEQERERLLAEASSSAATDEALAEAREAYAALRESAEEREQALHDRIDELTAEQVRASKQALDDRTRLEELEIRLAASELHVESAPEEAADTRRYTEDWHTLFLSTPAGYQLVEQEGPAPTPGVVLNLPLGAGVYRVLRLGPSPLPGDSGRCVYLEELSPPQA
ncbi:MAG TPA: hypothetical protein VH108_06145 [Gaiellaceae bacterium]|nr:hypothetical protein [Gaiellaceae bacterium]